MDPEDIMYYLGQVMVTKSLVFIKGAPGNAGNFLLINIYSLQLHTMNFTNLLRLFLVQKEWGYI